MTRSSQTPRIILITGCSSGIGRCVAGGLKARGWRVFATARNDEDINSLQQDGLEAMFLDLADAGSVSRAMENVLLQTNGRLDALFNNAAYGQPGAVEDLTREALRAQFETNLFGTHQLTCLAVAAMRRQGHGRIIQNSSVLGLVALPFRGAYNASKFALEGLSDTLRLELHGSNIHLSLIEPGPITSRFRANAMRHYRQNIDAERSFFRATYRGMEKRLARPGPTAPFTLPPEAVLKKVIHALESPRPRARYYVTFPTWLFAILRRLLPGRTLDRVLRAVSRRENHQKNDRTNHREPGTS